MLPLTHNVILEYSIPVIHTECMEYVLVMIYSMSYIMSLGPTYQMVHTSCSEFTLLMTCTCCKVNVFKRFVTL